MLNNVIISTMNCFYNFIHKRAYKKKEFIKKMPVYRDIFWNDENKYETVRKHFLL